MNLRQLKKKINKTLNLTYLYVQKATDTDDFYLAQRYYDMYYEYAKKANELIWKLEKIKAGKK